MTKEDEITIRNLQYQLARTKDELNNITMNSSQVIKDMTQENAQYRYDIVRLKAKNQKIGEVILNGDKGFTPTMRLNKIKTILEG